MNNFCGACEPLPNCALPCPSPHVPKLESLICPQVCICGDEQTCDEDKSYFIQRQKYRFSRSSTLGTPIGIIKTPSLKVLDADLSSLRFATYLKAFTYLFLSPEYEWDAAVLNLILKEGQKLFSESKKAEQQKKKEDGEKEEGLAKIATPLSSTYSESEAKIKRSFELLGSFFDVELGDKLGINEDISQNIGDGISPSLSLANLKAALKEYFKNKNYCLVEINSWYVLLWKANGIYFVLDVSGRRLDTFEIEKESDSFVVLMCLKTLENVYHLIANLSGFKATDICKLREMKVVKMSGPYGVIQAPEHGTRENEFIIVSSNYAYLTSSLHLTLKTQYPLRSRSALPVGVAAILASKIDHPATWTENVLDKIICYGVNVCRYCWEQCLQNSETIDFDCFPNQFRMGQFLVSFNLSPTQYTGIWRCIPSYQKADLAMIIKKCFDECINSLLIQINQQIYAVWKKNEFIYLLDPYRHKVMSVNSDGPRSAALHIFRTLDEFLFVFNYILLQSNRKSKFYIHTLQVKKIALLKKKDDIEVAREATGDECEVISLNETICFIEDDKLCLEELGQPSDDEEEDSLEEEEVPESEPEPENVEEEAGGAMEDGADIESSSEDGGVDDRRSNKSRGKDNGKKRKGGDKKKKNKRDMSERNKKPKESGKQESVKDITTTNDSRNNKDLKKPDQASISKTNTELAKANQADGRQSNKELTKPNQEDVTQSNTEPAKLDKIEESNKDLTKPDQPEENLTKEDITKKFVLAGDEEENNSKNISEIKQNTQIESDGVHEMHKKFDNESHQFDCKSKKYSGNTNVTHDIVVAASENGSYNSICKLLRVGFKCADRILVITPFGSFVVFCCTTLCKKIYFLFDGCTCNINRFRHMDICCETEGLMSFRNLHETINYMIDARQIRTNLAQSRKDLVDEIFNKFCPQDPNATCSLNVSRKGKINS